MNELPEAVTLAREVELTLVGRTVTEVYCPTHLHKFTFFNRPPEEFSTMLVGRKIIGACGKGIFVNIGFEGGMFLALSDGINMRYGTEGDDVPKRYQLLIGFDDNSFLSFTTSMYGFLSIFEKEFDNKYYRASMDSISPLDDKFDEERFTAIVNAQKRDLSVKALLATEQHIPGVGNGVLQDILFNASVNPRRKVSSLNEGEFHALYRSLKTTLREMTDAGGRDTETDMFGRHGGYATQLSRNTCSKPCPRCGGEIIKEAYMGGSIYYCHDCQPLKIGK